MVKLLGMMVMCVVLTGSLLAGKPDDYNLSSGNFSFGSQILPHCGMFRAMDEVDLGWRWRRPISSMGGCGLPLGPITSYVLWHLELVRSLGNPGVNFRNGYVPQPQSWSMVPGLGVTHMLSSSWSSFSNAGGNELWIRDCVGA